MTSPHSFHQTSPIREVNTAVQIAGRKRKTNQIKEDSFEKQKAEMAHRRKQEETSYMGGARTSSGNGFVRFNDLAGRTVHRRVEDEDL
jgi:hypothetical protein